MLHELLLALGGVPGSIFVKKSNSEIKVVEQLPFIHPAETALLNRLCQLATHYTNFIHFMETHGQSVASVGQGLYLKAVCLGLDKVLGPYRQTLVKLEKELMADPHLTAAYLQGILEPYQLLFPALWNILDEIHQQKVEGCHVLDVLHKGCSCGIPSVTEALNTLLYHGHQVLYKQLAGWILYGTFHDPYDEFFVHRAPVATQPVTGTEVEEDDLGLMGITGRQLMQALKLQVNITEQTMFARFALRVEMLPSYIPVRVAQKILFVGESVQMFQGDRSGKKNQQSSIFKKKEDEFGKKLYDLSQLSAFQLMQFEEVIDEIRMFVSEQLWRLVVDEAQLVDQLRRIKDLYLLGRGELFLTFIDQADSLLRNPPTGTTQYDVNMAFQQAARQVSLEDDTLLEHFSLTLRSQDKKSSSEAMAESGWDALNLSYAVQWPLHILFNQTALDRYNSLFRFLLSVKRTQLVLQQAWAATMRRREQRRRPPSHHQWLRNHMAFLVDNLQYYLQVDVIESQCTVLHDKIHSTRDFEAVQLAHDQFLSALLSHSFLLTRPVAHCLVDILALCHKFCAVLEEVEEEEEELEEEGRIDEVLREIAKNFQRQTSLLFQMLSSVRSHQASPHLAQLLLRIDFNKYFTLAGGKLGSHTSVSSEF